MYALWILFWDFKKSDFLQGKTSSARTSYLGSTVFSNKKQALVYGY
jgi:hypothetical protein